MELVYVNGELRELVLENTHDVMVARFCFRARARTLQRSSPVASLEPSAKTHGTPEQQAVRREFSACIALATALFNREVSFFTVRGDVEQLYESLKKELPSVETSSEKLPVPDTMTHPKTTEMSPREFELYARNTLAYTLRDGIMQPPQAA